MLRMSTRCTKLVRPQGRSLRWTEGRAQCGAIGTAVEHLNALAAKASELAATGG